MCMLLKNINVERESIIMFLFAIIPILDLYYFANTPFTYSDVVILISIFLTLFSKRKTYHIFTGWYLLYWLYAALHLIFFHPPFKLTYLVPGGMAFCMFSLGFYVLVSNLNIEKFNKYLNVVFGVSSVFFLFQFIVCHITGHYISCLLPIANRLNYGTFTYNELVAYQSQVFSRCSSLFAEPSYWAQYCLLVLCVEFFCPPKINRLYTKMSLFIIVIILMIQSGAGVVGLALLIVLKIYYIVLIQKNSKIKRNFFFFIPLIFLGLFLYLRSKIGETVLDRVDNATVGQEISDRSMYLRSFAGWDYLSTIDFTSLLYGSSKTMLVSDSENDLFFNGVTYCIVSHGLLGFIFLTLFYISNIKCNVFLSRVSLMLLLVIGLMEAIFLGPIMLLLTALIVSKSKEKVQ